ncbi:MAG: Mut7-C RNAse domain-containing protein [Syntrophobacterales bacterium]|jgi:uncharacterized protein with PIN domain|nr:Mut7-C RNAse domain-containing protein [Syntrophobacterales bacterium]
MRFVCNVMLEKPTKLVNDVLRMLGLYTVYIKTGQEFDKFIALHEQTPYWLFSGDCALDSANTSCSCGSQAERPVQRIHHVIDPYVGPSASNVTYA